MEHKEKCPFCDKIILQLEIKKGQNYIYWCCLSCCKIYARLRKDARLRYMACKHEYAYSVKIKPNSCVFRGTVKQ
jgi:hypothetical protein